MPNSGTCHRRTADDAAPAEHLAIELGAITADEGAVDSACFTGDRVSHQADGRAGADMPPKTVVEIEKADMQVVLFDEIFLA